MIQRRWAVGFDRVIPGRYVVAMVAESRTTTTSLSAERSSDRVTFDTTWDDDPGRERIPPGLDTMSPGPVLAGWLSSIDRSRLSGHDRIIVLRADQKMASRYAAQVYGDMASVVDAMSDFEDLAPDLVAEAAAAEVRAALRLTRQAADGEMALALDLRDRLPDVFAMLEEGVIDPRRARTIEAATCHPPPDAARHVVRRVLDDAPSLTTGELRARLRRLCMEADPEDAKLRYDDAVERRRVVIEATDVGTANLMAFDMPAERIASAARHIDEVARSLRRSGDDRTVDQLRADVAVDLLAGESIPARHRTRGVVDIRVDLATLVGLNDEAADIAGFGPVIADVARQVAMGQPDAERRFTVTDRTSGRALTSITRRRPTAAQRRRIESRTVTCAFPGCRMPATRSDVDHDVAYADGGDTTDGNLGPLCRRDQVIKHRAGWAKASLVDGGTKLTSRLGFTHETRGSPP
jgi:hypothetical protein